MTLVFLSFSFIVKKVLLLGFSSACQSPGTASNIHGGQCFLKQEEQNSIDSHSKYTTFSSSLWTLPWHKNESRSSKMVWIRNVSSCKVCMLLLQIKYLSNQYLCQECQLNAMITKSDTYRIPSAHTTVCRLKPIRQKRVEKYTTLGWTIPTKIDHCTDWHNIRKSFLHWAFSNWC